jgi:hypothetical protein
VVIVGLAIETKPAEQLVIAPDAAGYATVDGQRIATLSHLPGEIAVVEFSDGLLLIPWALLNQLMSHAAARRSV